jgi:hypothetical protein
MIVAVYYTPEYAWAQEMCTRAYVSSSLGDGALKRQCTLA